jgi:4-hydroxy-tetrahydrodipicolinate reductase
MTGIYLFGADGRMGQAIAAALAQGYGATLVEHDPDVFVDFTVPRAVEEHLAAAMAAGRPILIGTTGLAPEHDALIDQAAGRIAVIHAANTSLGVNLLSHLVKEAAARLGPDWDMAVVEMHHRKKVDAPSGTALLLGAAAQEARPGAHVDYASIRGGTVAGDHQVIFAGEGERIELGHRAESRAIFAHGAIRGAQWLAGKPPGRYTMADVLGLG